MYARIASGGREKEGEEKGEEGGEERGGKEGGEKGVQRGDEALNAMTPPNPDGQRSGVSFYEVALRKQR